MTARLLKKKKHKQTNKNYYISEKNAKEQVKLESFY